MSGAPGCDRSEQRLAVEPRKVVLHPIQVLHQATIVEPDAWADSPEALEGVRKFLAWAKQRDYPPIYLLAWPDGVRTMVMSIFPPGTAAWAQGILKGYLARTRGDMGAHLTSTL